MAREVGDTRLRHAWRQARAFGMEPFSLLRSSSLLYSTGDRYRHRDSGTGTQVIKPQDGQATL